MMDSRGENTSGARSCRRSSGFAAATVIAALLASLATPAQAATTPATTTPATTSATAPAAAPGRPATAAPGGPSATSPADPARSPGKLQRGSAAIPGRDRPGYYAPSWNVSTTGTDNAPILFYDHDLYEVLLFPGTRFFPGAYVQIGKSRLIMQADGNFVLYDERGDPFARWASNTQGNPNARAEFQTDGNLVVYNSAGAVLRTNTVPSNTCCHSDHEMAVQEDGNVVIYRDNGTAAWATGTNH